MAKITTFTECNTASVQDAAEFYASQGLQTVKILPHEKKPFEKAWQTLEYTSENVVTAFAIHNGNIGIMGDAHGLIGIDFDDVRFRDAMISALPMLALTLQSRGRKETGHYWVRLTKPLKNESIRLHFEDRTKQTFADLRGIGGQIVVAPSIHPEGDHYQWLNNNPILPLDTEVFLAGLDKACLAVGAKNPYRKDAQVAQIQPQGENIFKLIKDAVSIQKYLNTNADRVDCPVHKEETPSQAMRIYPATNSVYCFSCGFAGDVIALHAKINNLKPIESAKEIATRFGVEIPQHSQFADVKQDFKRVAIATWKNPSFCTSCSELQMQHHNDDNSTMLQTLQRSAVVAPPLGGCNICSASDLLQRTEREIEWLIPNTVPKDSICMLAAKRASLKTFKALDWVIKAAESGIKVLYFDYENGEFIIGQRLRGLIAALPTEKQAVILGNVSFAVFPNLKLDNQIGYDRLIDAITTSGATLIIVDTLRRISTGEENNSETSSMILDGLQAAITKTKCSFLLLHHMRKGQNNKRTEPEDMLDEIRGSSDITAAMSVIFYLKKLPQKDSFALHQLKNRYGSEIEPRLIRIEGEAPGNISVIDEGVYDEVAQAQTGAALIIREYLLNENLLDVKRADLIEEFQNRKKMYQSRSIDAAIAALEKGGFITKQPNARGKYDVSINLKKQRDLNGQKGGDAQ